MSGNACGNMKKKLCPFDKTECAGELCMAYDEDGHCALVCRGMSESLPHGGTKNETAGRKKPASGRREPGEKTSRFRAELFD
jgi:hypothetical protein